MWFSSRHDREIREEIKKKKKRKKEKDSGSTPKFWW
jgi:hypothetical protein